MRLVTTMVRQAGARRGMVGIWLYVLSSFALWSGVLPETAAGQECWWERGADRWYYKDDWKGLKITGASPLRLETDLPAPAVGGWIVVWGEGDGRLYVNDRLVDKDLDPCLIWDYDLAPFLSSGLRHVTLRIGSQTACAEGEILAADGTRRRFVTDANWVDARGNPVKTERMRVMASRDAFDKAHNGRLLTYNDEEQGKSGIAKCLARIQKLREQSIFLLRRLRPAEEIVSFDPTLPWRQAEQIAAPLLQQAQQILRQQSIPAQKAGRFSEANSTSRQAETLIGAAETPVAAAVALYQGDRETTHLTNWVAMLDGEGRVFSENIAELSRLAAQARQEYGQRDWASVHKDLDRLWALSQQLRPRLLAAAQKKLGPHVCEVGNLDEFPEDRFGWLNARDLMGNDPSLWPFVVGASSAGSVSLTGRWEFRLDPNDTGASDKWYEGASTDGWTSVSVPKPWERQGYNVDNLKSPSDAPYKAPMSGDKPYNGYAWYRKTLLVPEDWRGQRLMLRLGKVRDWYRVFVNGRPLGEGIRAREDRQLSADETVPIAPEAVRFGERNTIVVQVYNHNNFGGIIAGRPALYVEGQEPQSRETPGPLSYAYEFTLPGEESASYSALAGAMSPGVILACDQNSLEFWGWQAKGYELPASIAFAGRSGHETIRLIGSGSAVAGDRLLEKWLVVRGGGTDTLLVLEQQPQAIAWQKNAQGSMSLVLRFAHGPARAVVLSMPAGVSFDEQQARFWAALLRKYPISVSECVWRDAANRSQSCLARYNYLDLGQDQTNRAVAGAPVPMLASFACRHKSPGLMVEGVERTGYASSYASYLVKLQSDTLAYRMPVPDRSQMMKGVGELFARSRVENNVHGGLGEKAMFRRMADWGFDHCRYALAFDAQWDLPLVNFRTGSISTDEALWKRLDELIANCNEAGLQMMLCSFPEIRSRDWKARPERQRTMFEFWRRIAQRYAHLPQWAISYDFFNEPAYMNTGHYNEIMKELTALVRSVDQRHMIVWEPGDGWAQPQWCAWMEPVRDANVLYSFHNYGKHWGYAYDEYYPGYQATFERTQVDPWLEAILFGIEHHVPIHCGEFGLSMIQPGSDGPMWLNDYLAFFERFCIGWNWWNYSGMDIYRTGLAMGDRVSPYVPILRKWTAQSGWGKHGPGTQYGAGSSSQSGETHE